jgi:hypothetical protein
MRTRRSPIDDLRLAIDCLPVRTRTAMLEAIRSNDIIVGAYSDRQGGVCPMLGAHRHGGRTNFISFARAWDAFAHVKRARRATLRELRVLEDQLESSLAASGVLPDANLREAIAEHQAAARDRRAREAREDSGTIRAWRVQREARDLERAVTRAEADREPELV